MNPTSPNNGKNPKRLKRSLLVYYLGLLLIVIFINVLLSPSPRQIDYSDFIDLLDQGKIDVVQLQGDEIAIKLKDSEGSRSQVYTTINVGDPELTQRLLAHAKVSLRRCDGKRRCNLACWSMLLVQLGAPLRHHGPAGAR